jgi:hypothetical protein
MQLPTSAILSEGLKKRGNTAVASGGLADIWRGKYRGREVAIKAFRVYKQSENVKKVRAQPVREARFQTEITDSVGTGAHVAEVIP